MSKLHGKESSSKIANVTRHTSVNTQPAISVMLAVSDTPKALVWYKEALGATELWNLGSVAGLQIAGIRSDISGWSATGLH